MKTMLFWKIRYFHRGERQFMDRYLYLDTSTLDAATRAAVEIVAESRKGRDILRYRHLFAEQATADFPGNPNDFGRQIGVSPSSEYFEDETGKEIPWWEFGAVVTGDPDAMLVRDPSDVHLIEAAKVPVPVAEVTLTQDEERLLAYFVRDVKEMLDSEFRRNGPGTWSPGSVPPLKTAVTEEEIRSFVTIFRRLYMTGDHDPASFTKVAPIFVKAMNGHPYGNWVDSILQTYQDELKKTVVCHPLFRQFACSFTAKRLIDVFLYTQFAHQPDAKQKREKQYNECLSQVGGNREALTYMFLAEIWNRSIQIGNAGTRISWWFNAYCAEHGKKPAILASLRDDHSGFGIVEKIEQRNARLFEEKLEGVAADLWTQHGQPPGGPTQFLGMARRQLAAALGSKTQS